jgi:prepilin-type N-terminal cleavage/methylation domain-containing protein
MDRRSGVSLVEVVIAVAVVAILVAILTPAVGLGRDSANVADSTARLRQLGLAASQYAEDNGRFPGGCLEAARVGGLRPEYCALPHDRTSLGLGQECAQHMVYPPPPIADHRYTYYGYTDAWLTWNRFMELNREGTNLGWLVDMTPGKRKGRGVCIHEGPYLRLLFDGAVVRRHNRKGRLPEGRVYNFHQVFGDFPDPWYDKREL